MKPYQSIFRFVSLLEGLCTTKLVFVFTAVIVHGAIAQSREWTTTAPSFSPPSRMAHSMAYDASRGICVMFGGSADGSLSGIVLSDTWIHDGTEWKFHSGISPAPRFGHKMVYDSVREAILLYGGLGNGLNCQSCRKLGDLWSFSEAGWRQLNPIGNSPTGRMGHAMTFDPRRNRLVVFGGESEGFGSPNAELWEWDGLSWQFLHVPGPTRRLDAAFAFDESRGVSVLFGGYTASSPSCTNETWEWDGVSWRLVATSGPSRRFGHSMYFDPVLRGVVVLGGNSDGGSTPDIWIWNGATWSFLGLVPTPLWMDFALVFDQNRNVAIAHGGYTGTRSDSTREWSCTPMISAPTPYSFCVGESVSLSVQISTNNSALLRWMKDGEELADSGQIVGASTSSLLLRDVGAESSGIYRLKSFVNCGVSLSGPVHVKVCQADWNCDRTVDGDDLIAFVSLWDANSIQADLSADGSVDGDDLISFFERWDAGC